MDLWKKTLHSLSESVQPFDFKQWIQPIHCRRLDEGARRLELAVPDDSHGQWLEEHFVGQIRDALRKLTDGDYQIWWSTYASEAADKRPVQEGLPLGPASLAAFKALTAEHSRPALAASASPSAASASPSASPSKDAPAGASSAPIPPRHQGGALVERYRFDSFVDGPTNQFAMSAAHAVAESPGTLYNPLFIFGGVGLGKTHLLHAIGHAVRAENAAARVLYVTSEQYVNDLIAGIQSKDMQSFRAKYRDGCDVLLVDDVQFIAGKDRTQEEFFHMFNTLHSSHKQIVLTCDQLPQAIPDMEDRLKSRLQWGLIADIKPPGFETRVAILKKKAEAEHFELDDDIAMLIARHVTRNVRELEGALLRLAATAKLSSRPIDLELARQTLGILGEELKRIDPTAITKAVCAEFKVSLAELKGPRRHRNITIPRQIAMYLVRELTDESLPQIGQLFGGRDHSTVINSLRRVEALRDANPEIRVQLDRVRRALRDG